MPPVRRLAGYLCQHRRTVTRREDLELSGRAIPCPGCCRHPRRAQLNRQLGAHDALGYLNRPSAIPASVRKHKSRRGVPQYLHDSLFGHLTRFENRAFRQHPHIRAEPLLVAETFGIERDHAAARTRGTRYPPGVTSDLDPRPAFRNRPDQRVKLLVWFFVHESHSHPRSSQNPHSSSAITLAHAPGHKPGRHGDEGRGDERRNPQRMLVGHEPQHLQYCRERCETTEEQTTALSLAPHGGEAGCRKRGDYPDHAGLTCANLPNAYGPCAMTHKPAQVDSSMMRCSAARWSAYAIRPTGVRDRSCRDLPSRTIGVSVT